MLNVLYVVNTVSPTSIPIEIGNAVTNHTDSTVTIGALMENSDIDVDPDVLSMDVPIKFFGGSGNFDVAAYRRVWEHLKETEYDVLHTHHNFSGSISRIIGLPFGLKIVNTEHRDHSSLTLLQNLANAPTLPLADRVISNSKVTQDSFQWYEKLLLHENKLNIVYNGVDKDKIKSEINAADSSSDNSAFKIITVGRMVPVKNQPILLESFASFSERVPQSELVFVGDGPLRDSLEERARKLRIRDKVRFTGRVPRKRVYELLGESDVYVMPSRAEGFGVAVVEAMAAGLPVVISDIPIFHEVVSDPGVYFDPADSNMLAERILRLADNPEYRQKKALAARKWARSKFSLEQTAKEYYKIYKEVAGA